MIDKDLTADVNSLGNLNFKHEVQIIFIVGFRRFRCVYGIYCLRLQQLCSRTFPRNVTTGRRWRRTIIQNTIPPYTLQLLMRTALHL